MHHYLVIPIPVQIMSVPQTSATCGLRRPRTKMHCFEGILFISIIVATLSFTTRLHPIRHQHIHELWIRQNTALLGHINKMQFSSTPAVSKRETDSIAWKKRPKFGGKAFASSTVLHMTSSILGFDFQNAMINSPSLEATPTDEYEHWKNSTSLRRSLSRMGGPTRIHRMHALSPIKKTHASGGLTMKQEKLRRTVPSDTIRFQEKVGFGVEDTHMNKLSPPWLPYIPTNTQIQELKWIELKAACQERGLSTVRVQCTFYRL